MRHPFWSSKYRTWISLAACSLTFLLSGCSAENAGECNSSSEQPWDLSIHQPIIQPDLVLNVKDFQALGDGRSDDSAAFNSALKILAINQGGTLLVPSGTYLIGDVRVGSGISIRGVGRAWPVLAKTNHASSILNLSADIAALGLHDISIEHLTVRGRSVENGFSEHVHNIVAIGLTRLLIHDVRFESFQGDGLYLGSRVQQSDPVAHNSDILVTDSIFDGVNFQNRNGVSVIDCGACVFSHNSFTRTTTSQMPGAIDLEPNQSDEIIRDVILDENDIADSHGVTGGISISLRDASQAMRHILIENNTIQNSRTGILVLRQSPAANTLALSLGILIWGNVIRQTDHPMMLDGAVGIAVLNNQFTASRLELVVGCSFGTSGLRFISNHFEGIGFGSSSGIDACGPVSPLSFTNNEFVNLGGQAGSSAVSFESGTIADVEFIGNLFSSPGGMTQTAISTGAGVSFLADSNIWNGNVLENGIQMGNFPHGSTLTSSCH